jgi:hypothetical protein
MAWLEGHQSLQGHPKLRKAARLLSVSRPQLIGHLFCLWWWAIDYAPSGDVSRYDAADLALAAEWDGEPEAFIDALANCGYGGSVGFLERTADHRLLIHDWWEYAGKLIQRRRDDAERKQRERDARQQADAAQAAQTAQTAPTPDRPSDVPDAASINSAPVQRTSGGHPADARTDGVRTDQPTNQQYTQPTNQQRDRVAPAQTPDAPANGSVVRTVPKPTHETEHQALWLAFEHVLGRARTQPERDRRGKACKLARESHVTPEEILTAAAHWDNVMGDATLSELGLVGNLGKLLEGPHVNGRSNGTVREHRQRVTETAAISRTRTLGEAMAARQVTSQVRSLPDAG